MPYLLFAGLFIWSLGSFTSITIMSLYFLFVAIPAIYFLKNTNFRAWSKSTWALVAFSFVLILSVLVNREIMVEGFKPIAKVKYFLLFLLTIAPLAFYREKVFTKRNIKFLTYGLLLSATVAAISGMIAMNTGFNFLRQKEASIDRNAGLFGMLMTYAHAGALLQVLLTGLLIYRDEVKELISIKIVAAVWIINLLSLYLTYTRGAWIAFAVAIPFFFFLRKKKEFFVTIAGIAVIGTLVWFSVPKVRETFTERQVQSDDVRIGLWKAALKAFEERPILGMGFHNFEPLSVPIKEKYQISTDGIYGHAHNNYLEVLAVSGLLGIIAFTAWQLLWLWECVKRNDLIARLCFPFIIAFMAGGLTQVTVFDGEDIFFIMIVFSIFQIKNYLDNAAAAAIKGKVTV
ncbi:MAG: O-antigen ligase family protein [Bdellovibrionota bacterium]